VPDQWQNSYQQTKFLKVSPL